MMHDGIIGGTPSHGASGNHKEFSMDSFISHLSGVTLVCNVHVKVILMGVQ